MTTHNPRVLHLSTGNADHPPQCEATVSQPQACEYKIRDVHSERPWSQSAREAASKPHHYQSRSTSMGWNPATAGSLLGWSHRNPTLSWEAEHDFPSRETELQDHSRSRLPAPCRLKQRAKLNLSSIQNHLRTKQWS